MNEPLTFNLEIDFKEGVQTALDKIEALKKEIMTWFPILADVRLMSEALQIKLQDLGFITYSIHDEMVTAFLEGEINVLKVMKDHVSYHCSKCNNEGSYEIWGELKKTEDLGMYAVKYFVKEEDDSCDQHCIACGVPPVRDKFCSTCGKFTNHENCEKKRTIDIRNLREIIELEIEELKEEICSREGLLKWLFKS